MSVISNNYFFKVMILNYSSFENVSSIHLFYARTDH